jgi:hypothetical protein
MADIQGTNNDESLTGSSNDDNIVTGNGADTVRAGAGNAWVPSTSSAYTWTVVYTSVNGTDTIVPTIDMSSWRKNRHTRGD